MAEYKTITESANSKHCTYRHTLVSENLSAWTPLSPYRADGNVEAPGASSHVVATEQSEHWGSDPLHELRKN